MGACCRVSVLPSWQVRPMPDILYKLTSPTGEPLHGGRGVWSLPRGSRPGAWRKVAGDLIPCNNGLHLLRKKDIIEWLRAGVLWEAEWRGDKIVTGDKMVVSEARLVRKAAVLDERTLRLLACDFAEHVLPIFEKKYPGDPRPYEAIQVARRYADGQATQQELDVAWAARAATWAWAARAARDRERAWQTRRIVEVLGLR